MKSMEQGTELNSEGDSRWERSQLLLSADDTAMVADTENKLDNGKRI